MNGHNMYAEVQNLGQGDLITQHAALVKRIAFHLINKLPPHIQVDDLIQSGMVGLLEASGNFDASQGASFDTFAGIRIRGAMLDEIRKLDWTPRSVHRKFRMVTEAIKKFENENGRDPSDAEVAQMLNMSLDEYHKILVDANSSHILSIEALEQEHSESNPRSAEKNPFESLSETQYKQDLINGIKSLPQKEQLVMSLYYDDELNFREIGEVLEVSESRVCQIHGQAVFRLKSRLTDWHLD